MCVDICVGVGLIVVEHVYSCVCICVCKEK